MLTPIDENLLTAYALDELGSAERGTVEARLANDEAARRYVADVRAAAALLTHELALENQGGLSDLQHAAIEHELYERYRLPSARRRARSLRRREWVSLALSIAASIVIVAGAVAALAPFVYRRINIAWLANPPAARQTLPFTIVRPLPEAPNPLPGDAVSPTQPAPLRDLANADGPEGEQWVPAPDDRLAAGGSGHEEMTPAVPPVGPADVSPAPASPVQVSRGEGSRDVSTPRVPPIGPRRESNAYLPIDQQAPGKERPVNQGSSASATLPADESYSHLVENPFIDTRRESISAFTAGVDTASYSNIRRFLTHGKLPPKDSVRIEEMLNYFPARAIDGGEGAVATQVEVGACPWKPDHRLARICIEGREVDPADRPPVNLVFLIDVSPSMRSENTRLPLLKKAMRMLVGRLSPRDHVALVAYGFEAEIALAPTAVDDKQKIWSAIERIDNGGQTHGGQGVQIAYQLARESSAPGAVSRIILATDGNWNVGATQSSQLLAALRENARDGIGLTVLGVGMNNLKDAMLQKVAEAGNGSYAYVDTLAEAKKALVDHVNGALLTVARDVKVRVTFNASTADAYRLIGYERRVLSKEDFQSQSRRGGELGSGQSVTALYEIIPTHKTPAARPTELLAATVAYRDVVSGQARTVSVSADDRAIPLPRMSGEFRFASAVAEFGLLLHDSDYKGNANYSSLLNHALDAGGLDDTGYRHELASLIRRAKALASDEPTP